MNGNQIVTDRFSNPVSETLYQTRWQNEPATAENFYHKGKQCGGCSFFAKFNEDWGLCCHRDSRHQLETVFEHFTCPSYVDEGWAAHSFLKAADRTALENFDKEGTTICSLVSTYVNANQLGIITNQDTSYLLHDHLWPFRPDLGFIAHSRQIKMRDTSYLVAPDLVIKIVTSRDNAQRINHEVMMYLESGTREVWVLYPDYDPIQNLCVYRLTQELAFKADILTKADILDGNAVLPGFRVPVREIFQHLQTDDPNG